MEPPPTTVPGVPIARPDHLFKVIVVGESGAGKTSTVRRYVEDTFTPNYKHTIGVDFGLKILDWDDGSRVRLQLWDIAGQERFGLMTRVYYRDSHAAVVVFDITDQKSFDAVKRWKEDLDSKVRLPSGAVVPALLLANKCDSVNHVADMAQLQQFATDVGFIGCYEVSAKTGENVKEAFRFLTSQIVHRQTFMTNAPRNGLSLSEETKTQEKKGCCGN